MDAALLCEGIGKWEALALLKLYATRYTGGEELLVGIHSAFPKTFNADSFLRPPPNVQTTVEAYLNPSLRVLRACR